MISYRSNLIDSPDPAFPAGFTPFPESAQPGATFDVPPKARPRKKLDVMKEAVCRAFDTTPMRLESDWRAQRNAVPRFAFSMLARTYTKSTLSEIGRALGNRDHTSIMHALKRAKHLLLTDPDFEARYAEAEGLVKDATG